jgi:hypothetical protein
MAVVALGGCETAAGFAVDSLFGGGPPLDPATETGAAADDWPSKGVPNSILLTKPFAPAQLLTALSQLLNAGSPPTT